MATKDIENGLKNLKEKILKSSNLKNELNSFLEEFRKSFEVDIDRETLIILVLSQIVNSNTPDPEIREKIEKFILLLKDPGPGEPPKKIEDFLAKI